MREQRKQIKTKITKQLNTNMPSAPKDNIIFILEPVCDTFVMYYFCHDSNNLMKIFYKCRHASMSGNNAEKQIAKLKKSPLILILTSCLGPYLFLQRGDWIWIPWQKMKIRNEGQDHFVTALQWCTVNKWDFTLLTEVQHHPHW